MSNFNRNVDAAYYGSRTPLKISGTREGRKNPQPLPSYRHRAGDSTASSDKYYAAAQPAAVASPAASIKVKVVDLNLDSIKQLLPQVVAAFGNGATEVKLQGNAEQIRMARSTVDLAVGRNTLTRAQADSVSFVVTPPTVATLTEEEQELLAPPVKAVSKGKRKPKLDEASTADITSEDIAEAFGIAENPE